MITIVDVEVQGALAHVTYRAGEATVKASVPILSTDTEATLFERAVATIKAQAVGRWDLRHWVGRQVLLAEPPGFDLERCDGVVLGQLSAPGAVELVVSDGAGRRRTVLRKGTQAGRVCLVLSPSVRALSYRTVSEDGRCGPWTPLGPKDVSPDGPEGPPQPVGV